LLEGCPIVASIPRQLLIVSVRFGPRLSARAVAETIARGVSEAGRPSPDLCPIEPTPDPADPAAVATVLEHAGFDERMRAARAVVIAVPELHERALAGSLAFELATRARQSGVPAFAIVARSALDPFDARILDLQLILEAASARSLATAGGRLAQTSYQDDLPQPKRLKRNGI
jgi:glycerate kinase